MSRPMPAESSLWLVLIASLPTEDPAARMRMLRTLESLGAAVMREGAYLLPDNAACRQGLAALAEYIAKGGGSAQVLQATPSTDAQQKHFRSLFDRTARYEELIKVIDSLKVGYGIADPSAISRVLNKQRRDFEAISALDFFPNPVQERARAALAAAEASVHKLLFPAATHAADKTGSQYLRCTWVTRHPLWADRLASAWLIRRFVDPEGRVQWLDRVQAAPAGAVGFAFDGAHFNNSASQVSFEVLLARFGLADNAALGKIGAIVHFLETREAPVPEAAGVQTLLQGASRRATNDDEMLAEAEKTFDLLYEAYFEAPRA